MKEVCDAMQSGRLVEMFGAGEKIFSLSLLYSAVFCYWASSLSHTLRLNFELLGTAAIVSPVNKIGYQGKDIEIPVEDDGMGPVSRPIWADLVARQTGEIESDWSVVVYEE
jgi:hypothetical protein